MSQTIDSDRKTHGAREEFDNSNATYWDKQYSAAADEDYDWLLTFSDIRGCLETLFPTSSGVRSLRGLCLGCGNSTMSFEMYQGGFIDMVCLISHFNCF